MDMQFKMAPQRHLAMTLALRQALEILQMPQLELAQWLREEIEKNPLLEFSPSYSIPLPDESQLPSPIHLYDHLRFQVQEHFPNRFERRIAEELLESLDERGFLSAPLEEIGAKFQKSLPEMESILAILQSFDPPGICARNLQETLLLQLAFQNEKRAPAYLLVRDYFEDLLHGRYARIRKKIGVQGLQEAIQKLARLHFRPADVFQTDPIPWIHPDIKILKKGEEWSIELLEEDLPPFSIRTEYLSLQTDSEEERKTLRSFTASAKWLNRSLKRRRKLLTEITTLLVKKQASYLEQSGPLSTITSKEISEELGVHESTLSRAISEKYAITPRGLIPIRSLLSFSPSTQTAKEALRKMIGEEDKGKPLTDDELAHRLRTKGLSIARRTIAKYRKVLKIGPASQRKLDLKRELAKLH